MSQLMGGATGVTSAIPEAGAGAGLGAGAASGAYGAGGLDAVLGTGGESPVSGGGGGLSTIFSGIQNMLGSTPDEREKNAKALAGGVKDINSLVDNISQTTLLRRMMEAQSRGVGFADPNAARGVGIEGFTRTPLGGPIMSQLGFR